MNITKPEIRHFYDILVELRDTHKVDESIARLMDWLLKLLIVDED